MDNSTLLQDIVNYIMILKTHHNLQVSFHYQDVDAEYAELLKSVLHDNQYCTYVKSKNIRRCVTCKNLITTIGSKEPYFGVCYAGVAEYVFPIVCDGKTKSFISVSGYKAENVDWKKISARTGMEQEKLCAKYSCLSEDIPPFETVKPLIMPLVYMLCGFYENTKENKADVSLHKKIFNSILWYILENFKTNLSVADICKYVGYSQSFISHIFKEFAGTSIGTYVTRLKLEEAAFQLKNSDKKIIDIAYDVGYNDSNYFTNKFRAHFGMSPRTYRKKHR